MGTLHYLVSKERRAIFELGKNLRGDELESLSTRGDLDAALELAFNDGRFDHLAREERERWAAEIGDSIWNTIGVEGVEGESDVHDRLWDEYGDFIVVGTIYGDKSDVGRTYKQSRGAS